MEQTQHHTDDKSLLGFWIYLMTDLIMFAALFATYAVLRNNTFGGPTEKDLFNLPFVFIETLILLSSSFTSGLAMLAALKGLKNQTLLWLGATFLLGAAFLTMELMEFSKLFNEGATFQKSAFLSSYFTLVGTHGFHIAIGLLWLLVSMAILWRRGLNRTILSQLTRLNFFWHFLDIVWIFIFSFVYLMGVL